MRLELDSALSAIEGSVILSKQARAVDVNGEGIIFKIPTSEVIGTVSDALFSADGEVVVKDAQDLLTGLSWVYLFDNKIQRALDAPGRPQVIPDQPKDVYQVFYATADRSASTSSLPLSRNLLTCFLQLLTTTTTGTNGDFDVGGTTGADILGLGIPAHLVDFPTVKRIRDSLGDALETDLLLFGLDGSPLDVIDFFRTALRPFGVAIIDKGGLISVASLQDNDPDATTLIESTDLVGPSGVPEADPVAQVRRFDMCVDAYSVSFCHVPGHDLITDRFVNVARRLINIYGEKNAPTLELPFFSSRDKVASVVLPLLQRFDDPMPELSLTALRLRVDINLGDLVRLTHSKVFNATGGTRGVADALCLCVERTLDLSTNLLQLRLLYVGAIYARSGLIAPSAVVDSVVGSTLTLFENYPDDARAFQSGLDASGVGAFDISNFQQGDVIDHCDRSGVVYQQLTISSLTAPATVVVSPSPSPAPAQGDVLRLSSYDDVSTARQDRFAWLSDTNGTLGSGNDPGKGIHVLTDFKGIDATAYIADKPLDSFLLVRTHENLKACRDNRGRSASWCAGTINTTTATRVRPDVSGFRSREFITFLYHLSPFVTEVEVKVRHIVTTSVAGGGSATEATLSAFVMSFESFLRDATLPEGSSVNLTGGATSSSTSTFTIDVSDVSRGWVVVAVGVLSAEGTAVEITNSGGSNGPGMYMGFYSGFHILEGNANLGTTSEVKHWGLSLRTGTKQADLVPDRKAMFLSYDPTRQNHYRYLLFFYPQISSVGDAGSDEHSVAGVRAHNASTDALYYIPLGVVSFDSVTVTDSAFRQPDRGSQIDAGQPAGVTALQPEFAASQRLWLSTPRFHHMGAAENALQTFAGQSINLMGTSRVLSGSHLELCACVIGSDDPYSIGGSNPTKTAVTVKALIALTVLNNDPNMQNMFDLEFKIEATDLDGSTLPHSTTATALDVSAFSAGVIQQSSGVGWFSSYDDRARLLAFQGDNSGQTLSPSSNRGTYIEGSELRFFMHDLELYLTDDQTYVRRLSLQARCVDTTTVAGSSRAVGSGGQVYQYFPRIHVLTWSVASRPYLDEPEDLTDLGV